MAEEDVIDSQCTQTQTQKSQVDWSQSSSSSIPTIWGRLYTSKLTISTKSCWKTTDKHDYIDLIQPEFSVGRSLKCTFPMKKDIVREDIIRNVSKFQFIIKRDLLETRSPAIITDFSYNGTFVNGVKIGKGNSIVLDDNDDVSITHPIVKIFVFKDLLKNDQDCVPNVVSEKYYISRTLGQGACGVVKLVYNKLKGTKHAMKVIKKGRLTDSNIVNNTEKVMNEINILKALKHPLIVATEEVIDTPDAVYIILELMEGGELFDRITKGGCLSEYMTKFIFRQIVLAVKYLHSQGITHRDLKPENVLLESKEDETLVKISDFGMSKFVGEDSFMKTMCGTPIYLAPEVLRAKGTRAYGPEVDVWSLGVIFFVCLSGYLPFSSEYLEMALEQQIMHGKYRYSAARWDRVSMGAKQLMRRMLTVSPSRRITLDQILAHPWMQDKTVTAKVESLILQSVQLRSLSELTVTSNDSDEENKTLVQVPINIKKRGLSDSFNCYEPIMKKVRIDTTSTSDETDDTNSLKSVIC